MAKNDADKLENELQITKKNNTTDIMSAHTNRISLAATWLPRKIRGAYRCWHDYGFIPMIDILLTTFHLKSHPQKVPMRDYAFYASLSPKKYQSELKRWYKQQTGETLNLRNPRSFNEKIQWIKLYDSTQQKTRLSDKYLVREWIKEKIGEEYLVPLLGAWNSFDEINFDKLPDRFVMKCNHGSRWNLIVNDKSALNIDDTKKRFDNWMQTNYAFIAGLELQYKDIQPKIIAEEYLVDLAKGYEYQFWIANGIPLFVSIIHSPHIDNRKITFDTDWQELPFLTSQPGFSDEEKKRLKQPPQFKEIVNISKNLSKGFLFVRVDFYYCNNKFYFSEMTFTPATGLIQWNPPEFNIIFGKKLHLNKMNIL